MSILKQLKSKKGLGQDAADEPFKLEIRDGKTFLKVEPFYIVNNIFKNLISITLRLTLISMF